MEKRREQPFSNQFGRKQGNCCWFKHHHKIVDPKKWDLIGALNTGSKKREVKFEVASAADFNKLI